MLWAYYSDDDDHDDNKYFYSVFFFVHTPFFFRVYAQYVSRWEMWINANDRSRFCVVFSWIKKIVMISLWSLSFALSLSLSSCVVATNAAAAVAADAASFILFIINLVGARFIHMYYAYQIDVWAEAVRAHKRSLPCSHIVTLEWPVNDSIEKQQIRYDVAPVVQNINSPLKTWRKITNKKEKRSLEICA